MNSQVPIDYLPQAMPSIQRRGIAGLKGQICLQALNLSKRFGGQVVLDDATLELRYGDVAILRGENGSGKTTLLNILTGNLEPDGGRICYSSPRGERTYRFPRAWWEELNPLDHFRPEFVAREGVGRTWQDVRLFQSQSLVENLNIAARGANDESPLNPFVRHKLTIDREKKVEDQSKELLAQLGLEGRGASSADKVSLGQSKRVALARAVAAGASILFLDEPLAGLDGAGIRDVVQMLERLVSNHGLTLVVVEHVFNLQHVERLANVDLLLDRGKLVRQSRLTEHKQHGTSQSARSSDALGAFVANLGKGFEISHETLPQGARLTRLRCPKPDADAKPLLCTNGLQVKRGQRVLDWIGADGCPGLNLALFAGETVVLQAPNGWGKTSLVECLAGTVPSHEGAVSLGQLDLCGLKPWERVTAGLRLVSASGNSFATLTGLEVLRLAGATSTTLLPQALLNRRVADYSGGQRQLLVLAASVRSERAKVQIFDEPFSMLDSQALDAVKSLFLPHPETTTLIVVPLTHLE